MKKIALLLLTVFVMGIFVTPSFAAGTKGKPGKITPKSVGACALSFLVWPGIGQAVNDDEGKKVATHAILGLTVVFRFWSGYDALVDRKGGYWENRI